MVMIMMMMMMMMMMMKATASGAAGTKEDEQRSGPAFSRFCSRSNFYQRGASQHHGVTVYGTWNSFCAT